MFVLSINKLNYLAMTSKSIGKQVKTAFKAKKWTEYRIWKETGVKPHVFQSIMEDSADYTLKSLLKVCDALEIKHLGNVKEHIQS